MQREIYNDCQVSSLEKEDIFSDEGCYPITEDSQHLKNNLTLCSQGHGY